MLLLRAILFLPHEHFQFLFHLKSELITSSMLLFASDDVVVASADVNGVRVAEISVALGVVVNTGQAGRGLVLFSAHESAP